MAQYTGPIFDVDIHHNPGSDAELVPYFAEEWREYVLEWLTHDPLAGMNFLKLFMPPTFYDNPLIPIEDIINFKLAQSVEPKYGPPYDQLITDALDLYDGRGYAAILSYNIGQFGGYPNPHYAAALAQAVNNWNLDTWLSLPDDRLFSEVAISPNLPEEAAKEIRRVGGSSKYIGVCIGALTLGYPLGHPLYDPIYAAACEHGLSIAWHTFPADRPTKTTTHPGGQAGSIEYLAMLPQQVQHFVSSLIVNGTFEKFPDIKFVLKEVGVAWLPALIWQLDSIYDQLRFESPWVKRWPSEYIHDHIVFGTQPIDTPQNPGALAEVLTQIDWLGDVLCFASDYPHGIAYDDARFVARHLPESWHRNVFCDNACDAYGLPRPPVGATEPETAGAR